MSDTDSDDEFLSADEGEDAKSGMQENEVDELMDMLMNKGGNSNENESQDGQNVTKNTRLNSEKSESTDQIIVEESEKTVGKNIQQNSENIQAEIHEKAVATTEEEEIVEREEHESKKCSDVELGCEDVSEDIVVQKNAKVLQTEVDVPDDCSVTESLVDLVSQRIEAKKETAPNVIKEDHTTAHTSKIMVSKATSEMTTTELVEDREHDMDNLNLDEEESNNDKIHKVNDKLDIGKETDTNVRIEGDITDYTNTNAISEVAPEITNPKLSEEKVDETNEKMDNLDLSDEEEEEEGGNSSNDVDKTCDEVDFNENKESAENNFESNISEKEVMAVGDIKMEADTLDDNNPQNETIVKKKEHEDVNHSQDQSSQNPNLTTAESQDDRSKKSSTNLSEENGETNNDGWGWDNWADDFIINAAGKVSTLLETVEGQLGIPDPKAMAKVVSNEEKIVENQTNEREKEDKVCSEEPKRPNPLDKLAESSNTSSGSSWFSGFSSVSSITGLVQNTGTGLVSGGIGALEFIGKKTVDVLSDGDPGLRNKRDMLSGKKVNTLSAALKEAKDKSEHQPRASTSAQAEQLKFVDLFEKFQGNAHLDALEMLSSECDDKLERILNVQSSAVKEESMQLLSKVRNSFELDDDLDEKEESGDFKKELFASTKRLKMKVTCSKVLNAWTKLKGKSKANETTDIESPKAFYENTVAILAELSSRFIEYHRKVADMLILTDMQAKELAIDRASALKCISELFVCELTSIANEYVQKLINNSDDSKSNAVTDIYLESSNCTTLLRDCHQLVLPILQCSIIK